MIGGISIQSPRGPVGPGVPGRGSVSAGNLDFQSVFLIVTVSLALVIVIAAIASLYYRRRRRKRKHRDSSSATWPATATTTATSQREHSGRRRSRRDHRPRNPSLAESGGLPPVREGLPPTPPP